MRDLKIPRSICVEEECIIYLSKGNIEIGRVYPERRYAMLNDPIGSFTEDDLCALVMHLQDAGYRTNMKLPVQRR